MTQIPCLGEFVHLRTKNCADEWMLEIIGEILNQKFFERKIRQSYKSLVSNTIV